MQAPNDAVHHPSLVSEPLCPSSSLSPGHQCHVQLAFLHHSLLIPLSSTLYQQIQAGEILSFSGENGHWRHAMDLPHLWLHSIPIKSLVVAGGRQQPSEMLQAVRHFLFTLQARPLGFGPEWPLCGGRYICAETESSTYPGHAVFPGKTIMRNNAFSAASCVLSYLTGAMAGRAGIVPYTGTMQLQVAKSHLCTNATLLHIFLLGGRLLSRKQQGKPGVMWNS